MYCVTLSQTKVDLASVFMGGIFHSKNCTLAGLCLGEGTKQRGRHDKAGQGAVTIDLKKWEVQPRCEHVLPAFAKLAP